MAKTEHLPNRLLDFALQAAEITITNLRLRTFIGFNEEELCKQQDVIINAHIFYQADAACSSDNELTALNYKIITKKIIKHVENNQFRLLEKLTHDLLCITMADEAVIKASVRVDKPKALRFSDSVAITLSANKVK